MIDGAILDFAELTNEFADFYRESLGSFFISHE
jgi:hypothetical protein